MRSLIFVSALFLFSAYSFASQDMEGMDTPPSTPCSQITKPFAEFLSSGDFQWLTIGYERHLSRELLLKNFLEAKKLNKSRAAAIEKLYSEINVMRTEAEKKTKADEKTIEELKAELLKHRQIVTRLAQKKVDDGLLQKLKEAQNALSLESSRNEELLNQIEVLNRTIAEQKEQAEEKRLLALERLKQKRRPKKKK